jgi:hypothetical protein
MDHKKILGKFKDKKNQRQQLQLVSGEFVVGTEADEENRLWYVIDRGGKLVLEPAKGQQVRQIFKLKDRSSVTVKNLPTPKIDND